MHLVDDFLATGTQIKTERPGKAAGVVPVDSIEGPTVKLANGDVRRIDDPGDALEVRNGVVEILDLGEYLVNYGEFVENNHPLAPASYTVEWWEQDLATAGADVQALRDSPRIDLDDPPADRALSWATEEDVPLHPSYTYLWHDLSVEGFEALADAVEAGRFAEADGAALDGSPSSGGDRTLVLPRSPDVCDALETLLVEHRQNDETVTVPDALPLVRSLGFTVDLERTWDSLSEAVRTWDDGENAVEAVNEVAPFEVRERAPTRIGNRMGRPEKSEERELSPAVHTLFPIGDAGGSQRDVAAAASQREVTGVPGEVEGEVGRRGCPDCGTETFRGRCPDCNAPTDAVYVCPDCDGEVDPDEAGRAECPRCETLASPTERRVVDVGEEFRDALEAVGERDGSFDILKGVKGLTSTFKVPEPMEKGVLRAKNDVSAFKDGTVRYDMTDLPVTSVRASELDVSVGQLRELGYETDVHGDPLEHDDQLVELNVQDVVLSDGAAEHMLRTADYVDDLLEQYYGLDPFYDVDDRQDLVGELVFGMAPHTSAAVVGRVIGFTSAAVGYAHPYFHASKRRNCFHPDTNVWYRDEGGDWHHDEVEALVEERLDDPREDDFGTLVQQLDGDVHVPSVTEDGERVLKPVEAVSRHRSPDHLVRIETAAGRTIRVTPDHRMVSWDGTVEEVEARNLTVGSPLVASERDGFAAGPNAISSAVADGGVTRDTIRRVEHVASDVRHTYCLTVGDTHRLYANGLAAVNCDGDEDCVMLLLDGLLNFSKHYLPDKRGGKMDAPLVMSSRIDPTEIDDEAHNMDVVEQYPREFYEATREMADPGDVAVQIAESTLGTDREYTGFRHTHDTSDIALGPDLSAYKTLGSMMDKMDAQLELARKLRAVDETDVAERVIEYHFLPDLIGNLRAFSRQETRCLDCGEKHRRMPLTGDCRECGGDVNLTVHRGSVNKYMEVAKRVAEEYGCREYTKQRLEILDRSLESIFENDKNKQSGIGDFM
jgi:DNA polymerase II large subunit